MCLHLSLNALHQEIIDRYHRSFEEEMDWFYFPTYHKCGLYMFDELMIVPMDRPTHLNFSFWGNLLNWGPTEDLNTAVQFQKVYHVGSEYCLHNHKYSDLVRYKRCLIIADGYFSPDFYSSEDQPKYYYQKNKDNFEGRSIFSFAGIYEESCRVYNCAILTTQLECPYDNGQEKGKRVPVVLDRSFEEEWLRKNLDDAGIVNLLKYGRTKERFQNEWVSSDIYNEAVNTNQPYIIEPIRK